jgi:hypothetical protein
MKEKTDAKGTDIFWKIAFGVAAAGFVVTWAQPAGPLVAVPFAVLAMWLQQRASTAEQKAAPLPAPRKP